LFAKVVVTNSVLLKVLDTAIAEKVLPFFLPLGARHLVGESRYDAEPTASSLKARRHEELDGRFFWWINRFVLGDTMFEIGYGDRESRIETMLFYAGGSEQFAPWELLSAAQVPDSNVVSGEDWVLAPDFVIKVIERMAGGIRQHWNILGNPSPEMMERALVIRAQRMRLAQEEQRCRDRDRASVQAAVAFHSGRYVEAKRLLEPYRNDADLAPASAKMLEMAERKLG
jgi:hypothetical protein